MKSVTDTTSKVNTQNVTRKTRKNRAISHPHIIGKTWHNPKNYSPAICERCGSPIANEIFVRDGDGEIHSYGTTCARHIVISNPPLWQLVSKWAKRNPCALPHRAACPSVEATR